MMTEPNPHYPRAVFTVAQLADRWQVNARTIERALARGELRPVRIGRTVRIPLAEVERLEAVRRS